MNQSTAIARIGPNAILQVDAALRAALGNERSAALMHAAGLGRFLRAPPSEMIDEKDVIALHSRVRFELLEPLARHIMVEAGLGTADYLLAHRIPRLAQRVLGHLPARLASRILIGAIQRHTWTFAGSATCTFAPGHPVVITIERCPICRGAQAPSPLCDYYAQTFERLYQRLVHPRAQVRESQCMASGASACRFEIRWD